MPEEQPTTENQILTQLSRLDEKMDSRLESLGRAIQQTNERIARLEGGFEQMDRRVSAVEQGQQDLRKDVRQVLFIIVGTWVTVMLAILLKGG